VGKVFDALHKAKRPEDVNTAEINFGNYETLSPESADLGLEESPDGKSDKIKKPASAKIEVVGEESRDAEKTISIAQRIARPVKPHDKNLVSLNEPNSFPAEQFRMLRTNMLFPKTGLPPKSVLITSAISGEGKSFVAANLAVTIAQNPDKNVLLIDCDMRCPAVQNIFGYEQLPGLSDYLIKGTPLSSLLVKTPHERLTILPGGSPPPNPSELLSSRRMANLLTEVKSRYDDRFIIIDAPPPSLTSEANLMARMVDGIFMVIRCGLTNRDIIANMITNIGKEKIIGIIANDMDLSFGSYQQGKYSYYNNR